LCGIAVSFAAESLLEHFIVALKEEILVYCDEPSFLVGAASSALTLSLWVTRRNYSFSSLWMPILCVPYAMAFNRNLL
jgi:hypothetical protein